jgi:hypothetical protein
VRPFVGTAWYAKPAGAAALCLRCIQVAETDGRVMGVVEVTAKGEEAEPETLRVG